MTEYLGEIFIFFCAQFEQGLADLILGQYTHQLEAHAVVVALELGKVLRKQVVVSQHLGSITLAVLCAEHGQRGLPAQCVSLRHRHGQTHLAELLHRLVVHDFLTLIAAVLAEQEGVFRQVCRHVHQFLIEHTVEFSIARNECLALMLIGYLLVRQCHSLSAEVAALQLYLTGAVLGGQFVGLGVDSTAVFIHHREVALGYHLDVAGLSLGIDLVALRLTVVAL